VRALTVFQPWASLIAAGLKPIETRCWATHYRGRIAIHAGKRQVDPEVLHPRIRAALRNLPPPVYSAIIGTVDVVDCIEVTGAAPCAGRFRIQGHGTGYDYPADVFHFGNFADGRFAWILENPRELARPIPCRGFQTLWDLERAGVTL
jgi:activating signal cointegrator 1